MGFASFLEDILDRRSGEIPPIPQMRAAKVIHKARERKDPEIPEDFRQKVSEMLLEDGIPPYLVEHYIHWIHALKTGQRSMDQIWDEFVWQALPKVTQHLTKNAPITRRFVEKLMR